MPEDILGYKAYTVSEFLEMPNTPQPYLVEGLIYQRGKTVIVGKPKVGKSWLTLKLGLSVATGEPPLELGVMQASVLILEFDRRYLRAAVQEIAEGRKTDNMIVLPASAIPLNEPKGYEFLLESVKRFVPKDGSQLLTIIDHKSACFSGKENEDEPNRRWIETSDKVERSYPVSYLVVTQAPKQWRGEIVDLPIGSRILTAWADTVISIQKPNPHISSRRLQMISNYGEIEAITYTKDFQLVPTELTEETKHESAMTMIEERWNEFVYPGISKKVKEVADSVGCSQKTAWDAYREVKELKKMRKAIDAGAAKEPENE